MIYRFFVHLMALVSTREKSESNQKNDNNNNHEKELKQHTFRSGNMLGKTVQAIIL